MRLFRSPCLRIFLIGIISSSLAEEVERCVGDPTIEVATSCDDAVSAKSFTVTCTSRLSCNQSFPLEWTTPTNSTENYVITTTIDTDKLVSTIIVEDASSAEFGIYGCHIDDGEVLRSAEESIAFSCSEEEQVDSVVQVEPVEPIEQVEPVEPVEQGESVEQAEPIEHIEPIEHVAQGEPVELVELVEQLEQEQQVEQLNQELEELEEQGQVEHEEPVEQEHLLTEETPFQMESVSEKMMEEENGPEIDSENVTGSDTLAPEIDSEVTDKIQMEIVSDDMTQESHTQDMAPTEESDIEIATRNPEEEIEMEIVTEEMPEEEQPNEIDLEGIEGHELESESENASETTEMMIESEKVTEEPTLVQTDSEQVTEGESEAEIDFGQVTEGESEAEIDSEQVTERVNETEIDLGQVTEGENKAEIDSKKMSANDSLELEITSEKPPLEEIEPEINSETISEVESEIEDDAEKILEGIKARKVKLLSEPITAQVIPKLEIHSEKMYEVMYKEDFKWSLEIRSPYPNLTYEFYKEPALEPLDLSNRKYSATFDSEGGHMTFTIADLSLRDYGKYRVEVRSQELTANASALLFVQAPPGVIDSNHELETKSGMTVTVSTDILALNYQHFDPKTKRVLQFTWKYRKENVCWGNKNSEILTNSTETSSGDYNEHHVSTVTFEAKESGFIIFIAKNEFGESCASVLALEVVAAKSGRTQYAIIGVVVVAIAIFVGVHLYRSGKKKRQGFRLVKEEEMQEIKNHSPLV